MLGVQYREKGVSPPPHFFLLFFFLPRPGRFLIRFPIRYILSVWHWIKSQLTSFISLSQFAHLSLFLSLFSERIPHFPSSGEYTLKPTICFFQRILLNGFGNVNSTVLTKLRESRVSMDQMIKPKESLIRRWTNSVFLCAVVKYKTPQCGEGDSNYLIILETLLFNKSVEKEEGAIQLPVTLLLNMLIEIEVWVFLIEKVDECVWIQYR